MTDDGLLLHQHHYSLSFLREHSSHISARKRTASGEPDHFRREAALPPDPEGTQHLQCVNIGQKILGGLLWLSARARPDLSYSVSSAAQHFRKGYRTLEGKAATPFTKHQHHSSSWTSLLLPFLSRDDSFYCLQRCPICTCRKTFTVRLYHSSLLAAPITSLTGSESMRDTKIYESSAEAELYALTIARKHARKLGFYSFPFSLPQV